MLERPLTGLVLTGGGARAAYQVGVLRALARLRRKALPPRARLANPFGVICGTSAGAINAAALACNADRFEAAVETLAKVWENFRCEQVYRADSLGVLRSGAQWLTMLSLGWAITRWRKARPRSLLDNAPLAALLKRLIPLERVPLMLAQGHLHALAVTASSYGSGEHFTFYSSADDTPPWQRSKRVAVPCALTLPHLLASSAIPFVFPATALEHKGARSWYGDGSMRQTAPLSPAIHLGAERLLIVGAGRLEEPEGAGEARSAIESAYPNLAQIAGHALASIFLDALAVDIERMKRINRTLALLPESALADTALRPMEALVIAPSERLDDLASEHLDALPLPVRTLLRGVGVGGAGSSARGTGLASYLLFESPYTRALMALGEADVAARREEVLHFFGWDRADPEVLRSWTGRVPRAAPIGMSPRPNREAPMPPATPLQGASGIDLELP
jgi:NTE family protein